MYFNNIYAIAGNVITIKKYEKSLPYGFKCHRGEPRPALLRQGMGLEESRKKSAARAKANLANLINANFGDLSRHSRAGKKSVKLATFTFAENLQDANTANSYFHDFIRRLRYHLQDELKYICVPERQKRGAIHFHVILYCEFIAWKDLLKLWNHGREGSAWIEKIRDINNIGNYVSKYISKEMGNSQKGKKRYFASHGLNEQVRKFRLLTAQELRSISCNFDFYLKEFVREEKSFAFNSDWTGKTQGVIFSLRGNYRHRLDSFLEILKLLRER